MKRSFKLLPILLVIGTTALAASAEKQLNINVCNKALSLAQQGYKLRIELKGTPNNKKSVFFSQDIDLPNTTKKQTFSFDVPYTTEIIQPGNLKVKLLEPGASESSPGVYEAYYKHPIKVSLLYGLKVEVNGINSIKLTPTQDDASLVPIDGDKNYSQGRALNVGQVVEVREVVEIA